MTPLAMCVLYTIYFIILLLNILIYLNDEKTVFSYPFNMAKDYFLFNKGLVYTRYSNTRKFYVTYGFKFTIKVVLLKSSIIVILTYIWLLLINVCIFLWNSVTLFIIITVFFIYISQISSMEVHPWVGTDIGNAGDTNIINISSPGDLSYLYYEWVNDWIAYLMIDTTKKYFNIDLIKDYKFVLNVYSYIVMYPFLVLDFFITFISQGKLEWSYLLYDDGSQSRLGSSAYEIPSLWYDFSPNKSKKGVIIRLFIIYSILCGLHLVLTLYLCYLINVDHVIKYFLTFRMPYLTVKHLVEKPFVQYTLRNHSVYTGNIPLWKSKHPTIYFDLGLIFIFLLMLNPLKNTRTIFLYHNLILTVEVKTSTSTVKL